MQLNKNEQKEDPARVTQVPVQCCYWAGNKWAWFEGWVTFAFHALVDDAVKQGTTVVAKRRTAVCVNLEAVFGPRILWDTLTHVQS